MSERSELLRTWLSEVLDTSNFEIRPASEDASFRSYHRVFLQGDTYIVMDAPPQHEDCKPFIDITGRLLSCDVKAPVIYHKSLEYGFLLLSDFGNELYLKNLNQESADELYKNAIKTLAKIQARGSIEGLNPYDEKLLRTEMALFNDWLLAEHLQIKLTDMVNKKLQVVFDLLVKNALQQPRVFVHRDYHSRNLMLTEHNIPGVLDYQDAVLGPLSYDLVSLLKDCYIKWEPEQINAWVDYYLEQLAHQTGEFNIDKQQFQRWFDLMGVQRHLKASGIFTRLSHRDNKHGFLKDIPRTLSYIVDLGPAYPELTPLYQIIEDSVLPALEQKS